MPGQLKVGGNVIAEHTGVEGSGTVTLGNVVLGDSAVPTNNYTFRNKIINGDMRIVQRDNLPYAGTAAGFTFDRWYLRKSNGNNNPISKLDEQEVLDLGKVSVLKVENFADSAWIGQKIESSSVLPLANKTVTVSFYAKADTNTSGFRVFLHESDFNNTHGSPYFSYDVPITTSWQKFSYSMTIGNLVAANDNAYLNLGFGQSQTNTTVYLTGIQLEEGSVATPFEHRPYGLELSLCQRYYHQERYSGEGSPINFNVGVSLTNARYKWITARFPVTMHHAPTVTFESGAGNGFDNKVRHVTSVNSSSGSDYTPYGQTATTQYVLYKSYNESGTSTYGFAGGFKAEAEL